MQANLQGNRRHREMSPQIVQKCILEKISRTLGTQRVPGWFFPVELGPILLARDHQPAKIVPIGSGLFLRSTVNAAGGPLLANAIPTTFATVLDH